MPKVDVFNMKGQKVGDMDLNDGVFGVEINEIAMHTAVVNMLANARQGNQSTKTKHEVRGGGRKPWRQKGTGRARQGSSRSAQWKGGGVVLGPKPRSYRYTINKKVRRIALQSALSSKVLSNDIIVLDKLQLAAVKTKDVATMLKSLNVTGTALLVLPGVDDVVAKSARNIEAVKTAYVNTINTYDILKYGKLVITQDAVSKVEEVYA